MHLDIQDYYSHICTIMRRLINIFLASSLTFAAMGLVSCEKSDVYYRLYFPESPASEFGCEETVLSSRIVTNVPQSDLVVETPSWITATVDGDGTFRVQIARNETNRFRDAEVVVSDLKGRAHPISWSLQQAYVIRNGKGMVQFADCAFKTAVLKIADANGDYDISPDEALAVEGIVAPGKDIKDISGIEAFKNLWKLDLQDNDIRDASSITSLPKLYWLDLKGNKNLKTFDVRGCSEYFSHCEFEVTEELLYYCWDRQVNICTTSDPNGEHSKHVFDNRKTTDWSRQNSLVELKRHTEGDGHVIICLTGLGWLDSDMEDGTFERVMRESYEAILAWPWVKGHEEKIDFFYMERLSADRHQWAYEMEAYNEESMEVLRKTWDAVTGQAPLDETSYKVLTVTVDNTIRPHTPSNTVFGFWCGDFSKHYVNENQWQYIHCMNALPQVDESDKFYELCMSSTSQVSELFNPDTPCNFYQREDFFLNVF